MVTLSEIDFKFKNSKFSLPVTKIDYVKSHKSSCHNVSSERPMRFICSSKSKLQKYFEEYHLPENGVLKKDQTQFKKS